MAKALTSKTVESIEPDPQRRLEIADAALIGLYLVIQPTGAKSWALRYRHAGKPAKLTLGRWPIMGLAAARLAATIALDEVNHGRDPAMEKKAAKAAEDPTLADQDKVKSVVDMFMKRHAARNRRAGDVAAMFQREILPIWGERRMEDITKRDIVGLLDAVIDRGSPITANRLLAHLRTLWSWAKSRDIIASSPLDGLKPPSAEKPRTRVLTDQEIIWFWKACGDLGQPFGPLYQLLLLTGQRLRECADMTDAEFQGDIWTIPSKRVKNADEHSVPLSDPARDVLASVQRIKGRAGYVFTTTGESPVSGFTRAKSRLNDLMMKYAIEDRGDADGDAEIPPFTIHDLRRTAATGMARLRFPPHVVEAVLNHRSGTRRGIASVYNRFDYANEKKQALDGWGRYVFSLQSTNAGNVIQIGATR